MIYKITNYKTSELHYVYQILSKSIGIFIF
jgi:hypothetical protein